MPFVDLNANQNQSQAQQGSDNSQAVPQQNAATDVANTTQPPVQQNSNNSQNGGGVVSQARPEVNENKGPDFPMEQEDSLSKLEKQLSQQIEGTETSAANANQTNYRKPLKADAPRPRAQQSPQESELPPLQQENTFSQQNPQPQTLNKGDSQQQPNREQNQSPGRNPQIKGEEQQDIQVQPQAMNENNAVVGNNQASQGQQRTQVQPQPASKADSQQQPNREQNQSSARNPQIKGKGDLPMLEGNVEPAQLKTKTYSLQELLHQAIQEGASDLHLTAGYRAVVRVDGSLKTIPSQQLTGKEIEKLLQPVVKDAHKDDLAKAQDIDLSYQLPETQNRFRVNIFRQRGTLSAVFRVISNEIKTLDELQLPELLNEFSKFSTGLVLVTGPTGSGKSTTIASILNEINLSQPKHLITIEDPIEYIYQKGTALVDQREVYIDTANWTSSLKSILRQDPDVVMIGEMRDQETIESALRVAETGHLVFSTLHTNSAAQTVDRIIDAFPQAAQQQIRTQLAGTLMAVVAQRLVPVTGGGRRVAVELMVVTPAIRAAIREGKVFQIDNMIQTGGELGMLTMEKSLVNLVREGLISPEQAQLYANKPDEILNLLGKR